MNLSCILVAVGKAGSSLIPMSFLSALATSLRSSTDLEAFATSSIDAGATGITGLIISSSSLSPTSDLAALSADEAIAATSSTASAALESYVFNPYFMVSATILSTFTAELGAFFCSCFKLAIFSERWCFSKACSTILLMSGSEVSAEAAPKKLLMTPREPREGMGLGAGGSWWAMMTSFK